MDTLAQVRHLQANWYSVLKRMGIRNMHTQLYGPRLSEINTHMHTDVAHMWTPAAGGASHLSQLYR